MGNDGEPRVSRAAFLSAAVIAGLFTLLFFSYAFKRTLPFVEIDAAKNPHFTVTVLLLENFRDLFGSAVSAFASLSLRLVSLVYLLGAGAIAFASLSAGLFILDHIGMGELPRAQRGPLALALGLGVFSLATLGLGLAGLLTRQVFVPLVAAAGATGAVRGAKFLGGLRSRREPWTPTERVLVAFAALGGLITVVYALLPPMEFDALEYHLGAAADYYAKGRISYITYNVYSNFPCNSEMLYLMSMALSGSKLAGAIIGNVLNAYIAIAAAIAAYGLGAYISCQRAGAFAAAALITSMGFFAVATGVYVEPLQTLYIVLAVIAVWEFIEIGRRSALVAGALLVGLAMGVKYTSAVLVAVPLAASVLLVQESIARRIKAFVIFSVVAMLVVAPWLVKNAVFTGNPVYPLIYKVFDGRDWSPLQDARWAFAHTPKGGLAFEQWARHIFALFFSALDISLLSFVFIPFALTKRPLSQRLLFVLAFALLYVFLWFALTHRIDRFTVPAFAVMGAVSGAGFAAIPQGWIRRLTTGAIVLLLSGNVFFMAVSYGQVIRISVPLAGKYDAFLCANKEGYEAWLAVNRTVPPSSKVLLYAEAETFYLDVNYSASTVFDRQPLEEMAREANGAVDKVAQALKSEGFDYVFVNWATWKRQQDTYTISGSPRYEEDIEKTSIPAYSITRRSFDSMVQADKLELVFSCGPKVYPDAYALYRVK